MVVVEGSKLTLPTPCSLSSPPHTTSLLFEPASLSLALTHSDSSLSLFPSFSPSLPLPPTPQTLIPSPSSSSTFLLLKSTTNPSPNPNHSNPNPNHPPPPTVLFLVCGPHRAGSQILLRFYINNNNNNNNSFARVTRVICGSHDRGIRFEPELGVLLDAKHGVSVKLAGSVNYFAVYSVSCSKVWVFAAKMVVRDDGDGGGLRLVRCAVIRCSRPVWSLSISFGFLILGEENGVRVFGLRRLVKGKVVVRRVGNSNSSLSSKQVSNDGRHGGRDRGGKRHGGGGGDDGVLDAICNGGDLDGKVEKHSVAAGRYFYATVL